MISAHYLHLLINHFPVILPIVSLFLFLSYLLIKNENTKKTIIMIAYIILIFSAIITYPTFVSGGNAEELIEKLDNVEEVFIERHEEIAETFAYLSYLLGAISIVGFWSVFKSKPFAKYIYYVAFVVTFIVIIISGQTSNTGGEIRHQEIRSDFKLGNINNKQNKNSNAENENEDNH